MEIYVSPHTGKQYDVVAVPQSRTDYRVFGDKDTMYVRNYTEYRFFQGNKMVTWTYDLDPNRLSQAFGEIEGIYTPWETSPRD